MSSCPSPQQLEFLLDERLDDDEQQTIAAHVAACGACQATLEQLTVATEVSGVSLALTQSSAVVGAMPFLARIKECSPAATTTLPGDDSFPVVPGYEIQRVLGRGGMGVVYQARQLGLSRMVALKMILAGAHAGSKHLARFCQEAEAIASLHHPNIVQIYDFGEADGIPYCALEYVEDGNLGQQLHGDPQAVEPAVMLIETLARTIHFAHDHGIIHRDLKPANILLSFSRDLQRSGTSLTRSRLHDCVPHVTDFGLAKRLDEHKGGTLSGEIVGTPSYMAPEQAAGKTHRIGPCTDIYALGTILYEMLTGRPPFKGATPVDTIVQVLHEEPVRPSSLRPSLPHDLETICLKCLAKEPGRRYASAGALADDLRRFRTGKPILARPVSAPERAWKWARRRPLIASLLTGMIVVGVLGFSGVTWQWREATRARDVAEDKEGRAQAARAEAIEERKRTQLALYFSRIAQSQLQFRVNNLPGAVLSLEKCEPAQGQEDRRGWEWYYLFGLCHSDLLTLQHDQPAAAGNAVFDPAGKTLVSVLGGHPTDDAAHAAEVRVWDADSGALLHRWRAPGTAHRVVFRPDGTRFALATTDGAVLIWDAVTGEELLRTPPTGQLVQAIAFSPDGKRLALAGWDETVKICNAATGEVLLIFRGHSARVQSVAFHPDGKHIASGDGNAIVKFWEADTGTEKWNLLGHKSPVFGVTFSPNGKLLASGSSNGNLRIWDLKSGFAIQSLTSSSGAVLGNSFSPDGRYVAYCGGDGTVRVWDVESGVQRVIFRGHNAPVESVQFSPDGRRLVSCSPQEANVKIWNCTRHPERATFARVRGRSDEKVKVRDLTERADAATLARTGPDLEALAFASDGRRLVSITVSGKLQTWDAATGMLVEQRAIRLSDELVTPAVLATFAPDGTQLAGRSREDRRLVKTWDVEGGTEQVTFRGHTLPVFAIRFSSAGARLATAACDLARADRPHEVKVWDTRTGACLATLNGQGVITSVAFSPGGRRLALVGQDGAVLLADWANSGHVVRLRGHRGLVAAVAFSSDGKWLASAGVDDRQLRLWSLEAFEPEPGQEPLSFTVTAPPYVCDLAFSPDGTRLAGISRDMVKLWDVGTRHEIMTLRGAPQRHWDPAFNPRVLFSPDGKRLVGTNWDESISMWDASIAGSEESAVAAHRAARRHAAAARAAFWHLEEAEDCCDHKNFAAARFHLEWLGNAPMPAPLQTRKERLAATLPR